MASQYKVVVRAYTPRKLLHVVRVVREISGLGLKEARDLVKAHGAVAEGLTQEIAVEYKSKLETAGATVEVLAMEVPIAEPTEPHEEPATNTSEKETVMGTQYKVIIQQFATGKKIELIKVVRLVTGLGLKAAKDLVDSGGTVIERISEEQALDIELQLKNAGAEVEVLPMQEPGITPQKPEAQIEISSLSPHISGLSGHVSRLKSKNIQSLSDIRRAGGLSQLEGLNLEEQKVAERLEAHAYLNLVSEDPQVCGQLIEAGIYDIANIATQTQAGFLRKTKHTGISEEEAVSIHARASAMQAILTNVITSARAETANGLSSPLGERIKTSLPPQTSYDERTSAVSPAAYLADLLDYVCKTLKKRLQVGCTPKGNTNWEPYKDKNGKLVGFTTRVDTQKAGFTTTPVYLSSLAGYQNHSETTGGSCIYEPELNGFRVYVRYSDGREVKPDEANSNGWYIQWLGIEAGSYAGSTPKGNTDWEPYQDKDGKTVGFKTWIDTSAAGFSKTPIYLTSLGGDWCHWETTGSSCIYEPTPNGFRVYVRFSDGKVVDPQDANKYGWYIQWLGIEPGIIAGSTSKPDTHWEALDKHSIKVNVDTSSASFAVTPVYLVSLGGNWYHWATTGATSIYEPTREGFCIHVHDDERELSPEDANTNGWHVQWLGIQPIDAIDTISELENRFHQPFGRLPVLPDQVDLKVRQVRLATEALRSYLSDTKAVPDYQMAAYQNLLNQVGTSYDEIRLVRIAPVEQRQALANRLGIGNALYLDQLLLIKDTLSEFALEQLFGLVGSARNPLSTGAVYGDKHNQLVQWNLTGVEWNRNTNLSGSIYLKLKQEYIPREMVAPNVYVPAHFYVLAELFRDEARKECLAVGEVNIGLESVLLNNHLIANETNQSGLNAEFDISIVLTENLPDQPVLESKIIISAIPQLLTWRQQHLRALWLQQDWPSYFPSDIPIIDPDLIHPEYDFRSAGWLEPEVPTKTRQVWLRRRNQVDQKIKRLQVNFQEKGYLDVLESVLNSENDTGEDIRKLYKKVQEEYGNDFADKLAECLAHSDKTIVEKALRNVTGLGFSVESFVQLVVAMRTATLNTHGASNNELWRLIDIAVPSETLLKEDLQKLRQKLYQDNKKKLLVFIQLPKEQDRNTIKLILEQADLEEPLAYYQQGVERLFAILEYCAILSQVWKVKASKNEGYKHWIETEQKANIVLGPQDFWLSTQEPELYPWLATAELRQMWRLTLTMNSRDPLIDPDLIGSEDLRDIRGSKAVPIFNNRNTVLKRWKRELQETWQANYYHDIGGEEGGFQLLEPGGVSTYDDFIYVADTGNHRILKLDRDGNLLTQWGDQLSADPGKFNTPGRLTLDADGCLYVADTGNKRIQKFNRDGEFVCSWGDKPGLGKLTQPLGLAVDIDSDKVYVADGTSDSIQVFRRDGRFRYRILGNEQTSNEPQALLFKNPRGVAVDKQGNLFIADTGNHQIRAFNRNGHFLNKWTIEGKLEIDPYPQAIWVVHKLGLVFVADTAFDRVLVFSHQGELVEQLPLGPAVDVAVDEVGNICIADRKNNKIRVRLTNPKPTLPDLVKNVIGESIENLRGLDAQRKKGEDISARLEQVSLSLEAFKQLMLLDELIEEGLGIHDVEWEEIFDILVQVKKRRAFAQWREQEKNAGITLCQDFFRIAEDEPIEINRWCASREARWDWQDRLTARIDQEKMLVTSLAEAVDACEEATLVLLRDGLIKRSKVAGKNLTEKAKHLAKILRIDFQSSSSIKTTRISQAITTLQNLVFSLRTGQLDDPTLSLDTENLDEEWSWMGSYETWKAAMGVFLYPDSLLLPQLRREQSPAFKDLVSELRRGNQLTPKVARAAAERYAEYFNDICSLVPQASVMAINDIGKELVYLFALGGNSQSKVYMSWYEIQNPIETQSFWYPVPGLGKVIDVVGATVYRIPGGSPYIFLFVRTLEKGAQKLHVATCDLDRGSQNGWSGEAPELKLPKDDNTEVSSFQAVVQQCKNGNSLPRVAIRILPSGEIFLWTLNRDGSDWKDATEEEKPVYEEVEGDDIVSINALFDTELGDPCCLIGTTLHRGQYHCSFRFLNGTQLEWSPIWENKDKSVWADRWLGGFISGNQVHAFWRCSYRGENDPDGTQIYHNLLSNMSNSTKEISTLDQLNGWLGSYAGAVLNDLKYDHLSLYTLITYARAENEVPEDPEPPQMQPDSAKPGSQKPPEKQSYKNKAISALDYYNTGISEKWNHANSAIWAATKQSKTLYDLLLAFINKEEVPITLTVDENQASQEPRPFTFTLKPQKRILFATGGGGIDLVPILYKTIVDPCIVSTSISFPKDQSPKLGNNLRRLNPVVDTTLAITDDLDGDSLQLRRIQIERIFTLNLDIPQSVNRSLIVLKEACYSVPMYIALQLQRSGHFTSALDWMRTVYNYAAPPNERKIYYELELEEPNEEAADENPFIRPPDWLRDPLDVHELASSRCNAYTRFTVLSIIRCLLAFADREFTCDTAESLPRARTLYETVFELLEIKEVKQELDIIGQLEIEAKNLSRSKAWNKVIQQARRIQDWTILQQTVESLRRLLRDPGEEVLRVCEARKVVQDALASKRLPTVGMCLASTEQALQRASHVFLTNEAFEKEILRASHAASFKERYELITGKTGGALYPPVLNVGFIPGRGTYQFPIPANPLLQAIRRHAENNLRKLRAGRNVAGVKREIEAYTAPIDVLSALPSIGAGGQIVLPVAIVPPPVPYRYQFLVERARILAGQAAQMEGALLSAFERRDMELYNLFQARQDIRMARAGLRLQDLRLRKAKDDVDLAELQRESTNIHVKTYTAWLEAGLNQWERKIIDSFEDAEDAQIAAIALDAAAQIGQAMTTAYAAGKPTAWTEAGITTAAATGAAISGSFAAHYQAEASISSVYAAYERRAQEWQFQLELAQNAQRIGDQQIRIAEDGVDIAEQEKEIAQIQVEHAEAVVEFLNNKFTNFELYDWMSGVLEEIYSYFLQQATAMAKLAQNQLAFERQEPPPAFIQNDYWVVPIEDFTGSAAEDSIDRHGLTGSARLMADIYHLDQYHMETEKRKLQLTKVFSLAHLAPYEFQRFREKGVLVFATPMTLFDQDFPGHYLRMIQHVRTSVVALIPPVHGIKATLTNAGISRLAVNREELFQTITTHRPPEAVALTSPINASGLFELEAHSEMMLPFECLGVDTIWELRMPKAANQFDFHTIADVLISIDYTALDSWDYRQQVIETLRSKFSGERPFSFRHQFADAWYDLHNPDHITTPMTVRFKTHRNDFPPNLERLQIQHILLYFARKPDADDEIKATLKFKPEDGLASLGGDAVSVDGVISTRRGNAGSWMLFTGSNPVGEWELSLPGSELYFKNDEIEDILFVITFSGRTPVWPE